MYMYTNIYTYTRKCIYIYIHAHTHTHTYIYIYINFNMKLIIQGYVKVIIGCCGIIIFTVILSFSLAPDSCLVGEDTYRLVCVSVSPLSLTDTQTDETHSMSWWAGRKTLVSTFLVPKAILRSL